jgi:hypothetical protein
MNKLILKILTETLLKEIVPIAPEAACDPENCFESCNDMYVHIGGFSINLMRNGHWRKMENGREGKVEQKFGSKNNL